MSPTGLSPNFKGGWPRQICYHLHPWWQKAHPHLQCALTQGNLRIIGEMFSGWYLLKLAWNYASVWERQETIQETEGNKTHSKTEQALNIGHWDRQLREEYFLNICRRSYMPAILANWLTKYSLQKSVIKGAGAPMFIILFATARPHATTKEIVALTPLWKEKSSQRPISPCLPFSHKRALKLLCIHTLTHSWFTSERANLFTMPSWH